MMNHHLGAYSSIANRNRTTCVATSPLTAARGCLGTHGWGPRRDDTDNKKRSPAWRCTTGLTTTDPDLKALAAWATTGTHDDSPSTPAELDGRSCPPLATAGGPRSSRRVASGQFARVSAARSARLANRALSSWQGARPGYIRVQLAIGDHVEQLDEPLAALQRHPTSSADQSRDLTKTISSGSPGSNSEPASM